MKFGSWKDGLVTDDILSAFLVNVIPEVTGKELLQLDKKPHPIKIKEYRAEMHLKIYWSDESHGDADNVFKGVADSLFENDKELDGSFESFHTKDGKGIGRIEGIIIFDAGFKYV